MTNVWPRAAVMIAGLMGAAGVALAAAAAHLGDAARLGPASSMLLFHAPALLAITALAANGTLRPRPAGLAAGGICLGALLFSGDLTLRHFADRGLFPMAAPTGGTLLIFSWLALAIVGLRPRRP